MDSHRGALSALPSCGQHGGCDPIGSREQVQSFRAPFLAENVLDWKHGGFVLFCHFR